MDGELRKLFRRHLPDVAWSSIETGHVEPGVADMNGCHRGVEAWVEMKRAKGFMIDVKISQVAWHRLRQYHGSRTFFAVRRRVGGEDTLYLFPGSAAEALLRLGLKTPGALLVTGGGPSRWDWNAIRELVFGQADARKKNEVDAMEA